MTWNNGEVRVGRTSVSLRGSVAIAVSSKGGTARGRSKLYAATRAWCIVCPRSPRSTINATESTHAYPTRRDVALGLRFLADGGGRARRAEHGIRRRRAARPHESRARRQSFSAFEMGADERAAEDDDAPRARRPADGAERPVQRHAARAGHGRLCAGARRAGPLQRELARAAA